MYVQFCNKAKSCAYWLVNETLWYETETRPRHLIFSPRRDRDLPTLFPRDRDRDYWKLRLETETTSLLHPHTCNLAVPSGESQWIIFYVVDSKPVSVFAPLCKEMTLSIKQKYITHCTVIREELSHSHTKQKYRKINEVWTWFLRYAAGQTDPHTDMLITTLCTPQRVK